MDVDLLVNNAGFGLRGRFLELDPEREAEMVRVNCEAVVTLTHAFLPGMVERGRGGVITVASTAGMQPLPYETTYGASKAFAISFMEALCDGASRHRRQVPGRQPRPGEDRVAGGRRLRREHSDHARHDHRRAVRLATRSSAYDRGKRSMITGRFFPWFMRASTGAPKRDQAAASPSACTAPASELGRSAQAHVRVVLERLGDRPIRLRGHPRPAAGRLRQRPGQRIDHEPVRLLV